MWGRGKGKGKGKGSAFSEDLYFDDEEPSNDVPTTARPYDARDAFMFNLVNASQTTGKGLRHVKQDDPDTLNDPSAVEMYLDYKSKKAQQDQKLNPTKKEVKAEFSTTAITKLLLEPHQQHQPSELSQAYNDVHNVKLTGKGLVRPIMDWAEAGCTPSILNVLTRHHKYSRPTAIQANSLAVLLGGRDLIATAPTGEGKTFAYLVPMVMHIGRQPDSNCQGPKAVVLTPTRELANQVYDEALPLCKAAGLSILPIIGGVDKTQQYKLARRGFDVAVGTPGRLDDLVSGKAFTFLNTTWLTLDEFDKLFDMGFEVDVKKLVSQIRPDRQVNCFSATSNPVLEKRVVSLLFAGALSTDVIKLQVGEIGSNAVKQIVQVVNSSHEKLESMSAVLDAELAHGSVLVFANTKDSCDKIDEFLRANGTNSAVLHSGKLQAERAQAIENLKNGSVPVLVCTDVATRGLNLPTVKTVISYDVAKLMATHIQRIGRVRMGSAGSAYTILTRAKDSSMASDLVKNLQQNGQEVPADLASMANAHPGKNEYRAPRIEGLGHQVREDEFDPLAHLHPQKKAEPQAIPPSTANRASITLPLQPAPSPTTLNPSSKVSIIMPPQHRNQSGDVPKKSIFGNRKLADPLIGQAATSAPIKPVVVPNAFLPHMQNSPSLQTVSTANLAPGSTSQLPSDVQSLLLAQQQAYLSRLAQTATERSSKRRRRRRSPSSSSDSSSSTMERKRKRRRRRRRRSSSTSASSNDRGKRH
ncbi:hypothetical protein DIPPA_70176 [Diplonema papillatum]|nr:hypothetical protein DIPPA_70176 [Diplonema papillatum]WGM49968.1 DDX42 [Diplonema papillatum]